MILTIIDVIIGKYTVTFPFLKVKSPGSLPITLHNIPITTNMIPNTIKIFPNSFKFWRLPLKMFINEWSYNSSSWRSLNKTYL
jgi:hypothetical protein